jgi:hypothetical protein
VTSRTKRWVTIAAAAGCLVFARPGFAFDTHTAAVRPPTGLAASGTPDLSSDKSNEAAARYRVDPLNYDDRWASMFGSAFPISKSVSLFADYQYDQWAPRSSGADTSFRAWENYRVTVGCTFRY